MARVYADLAQRIKKAESVADIRCLERIEEAAKRPQFWTAAAWRLERRNPALWGKRDEDASGPRIVVNVGVRAEQAAVEVSDAAVTRGVK